MSSVGPEGKRALEDTDKSGVGGLALQNTIFATPGNVAVVAPPAVRARSSIASSPPFHLRRHSTLGPGKCAAP
jgi:hypothetical protein